MLREDSAYLLTDMLRTCAQSGTAKKLESLGLDIASKTGTVGKPGSKQNLDAWNVSYTKAQTCGVWLGNLDNTPITYAGGNQPTEIVKNYFAKAGDDSTFTQPSSIIEKNVDSTELNENHRVVLANIYMPERYTQKELFSSLNLPSDISEKFTKIDKTSFSGKVESNVAKITFESKDYITYEFIIDGKTLESITGKNGEQTVSLPLNAPKQKVKIKYYYTLSPTVVEEDEINFIKTQKTSKTSDKWFI